jgi:D-alanine-D-alanine ligase
MKIAVVYNRDSSDVINLFGRPNQEKIGLQTIKRLVNALKEGGHQVIAVEGDKNLIDRLEDFMPRVVHGERPGMVFNVSYGLQGQARYTHVPSILEMIGIPYVASGPLGHSLSLDKVVTKMILQQHGLPTPGFALLDSPDGEFPEDFTFPAVVKPKNEAVSFGLKVVQDPDEMREAAAVIFNKYGQTVLVEEFIAGREVNVGILGNSPPEALPPVELDFGSDGPQIYTYEDKTGRSGRQIRPVCPAPLTAEQTAKAQDLAVKAFRALGLYDCARVDMRLDGKGRFFILETNSLPSLGEHGSYLVGAAQVGLDFAGFVNRLVEVASARYFGTPSPPALDPKEADATSQVHSYLTSRRADMERSLERWIAVSSRTSDPVGLQQAASRAGSRLENLGLQPVPEFTDDPDAFTWQTKKGLDGGTLLVAHLDVPLDAAAPYAPFHRGPEMLHGEGVGASRAPLVMLEYALRALRSVKGLRKLPVGVFLYTDEGRDVRKSEELFRQVVARARQVLVLRPGTEDGVVVRRRGNRRFRLTVRDKALLIGRNVRADPLRWSWDRLERIAQLTSARNRVSVATLDARSERYPMRLPHRVVASVLLTYADPKAADATEARMRTVLGRKGPRWDLVTLADRPPMRERRTNARLYRELTAIADELQFPLKGGTSVWPSVAGLVPAKTAAVCGLGPVTRDRGTPNEGVLRISLVQRTLLLAQFLASQSG